MHLEFFEDAAAEIEQDRAWYRERSESAEADFLRELDHAIQQVTDAPVQWPRYLAGTRRYVFPTYPYSLVYFIEDDVIRVVAVAHDKRRPGYWREPAIWLMPRYFIGQKLFGATHAAPPGPPAPRPRAHGAAAHTR